MQSTGTGWLWHGTRSDRTRFGCLAASRRRAEAQRVLRSGGIARLWASSGGGEPWVAPLEAAGFTDVTIEGLYSIGVTP